MIQKSINKVTVKQKSTGVFDIEFYGSLDLDDVTIDQHVQQRIQVADMMKSARTLGKTTASKIISTLSSKNDMQIESSGMATIQKVLGEARAAQIKATGEAAAVGGSSLTGIIMAFMLFQGGGSKILIFIIVAIVIYIVAAWYFKFFPFSKPKPIEVPEERRREMKMKPIYAEVNNHEHMKTEYKGKLPYFKNIKFNT
jgi:hypothetical protein